MARAQIEKFNKKILPKKIFIGKSIKKSSTQKKLVLLKKFQNFKSVYWLNSIFFPKKSAKLVKKIGHVLEKKGHRSKIWILAIK